MVSPYSLANHHDGGGEPAAVVLRQPLGRVAGRFLAVQLRGGEREVVQVACEAAAHSPESYYGKLLTARLGSAALARHPSEQYPLSPMTDLQTLAAALASTRRSLPDGSKGTAAHLFGIAHAVDLDPLPIRTLEAIAVRAGLDQSIGAEIRKGVKLAPYVAVRKKPTGMRGRYESAP